MRLDLICPGRLGDVGLDHAYRDYLERLRRCGPSIGLRAVRHHSTPSKALLSALTGPRRGGTSISRPYLVLLDAGGDRLNSHELAKHLAIWCARSQHMVMVIGDADGHIPVLRDGADWRFSLGSLTWPHRLARVMLVEQLYRGVQILRGHPYHHD